MLCTHKSLCSPLFPDSIFLSLLQSAPILSYRPAWRIIGATPFADYLVLPCSVAVHASFTPGPVQISTVGNLLEKIITKSSLKPAYYSSAQSANTHRHDDQDEEIRDRGHAEKSVGDKDEDEDDGQDGRDYLRDGECRRFGST